MPITLPNLDDRTFADLVKEAHGLIPVHAPEWTNHNESDPGITLIEMFAYLTEMLIYRLNRVTDANVCAFLRLIDGIERIPSTRNRGTVWRWERNSIALANKMRELRKQDRAVTLEDLELLALAADPPVKVKEFTLTDEVREVVLKLRQQDRTVTCKDFERLALAADSRAKRAHCVPQCDLTSNTPYEQADAYVSVVIVPAFDSVLLFDGSDFSDATAASTAGGRKILLLPPTKDANPLLYLGSDTPFESVRFNLAETGAGYALTFRYFDGKQKDWLTLTTNDHKLADSTSDWGSSGLVTFTPPREWKPIEINGVNRYWISTSTSRTPRGTAAANQIVPEVTEKVRQHLEPRRLLTTRVRVTTPRYLKVAVQARIFLKPDAVQKTVLESTEKALRNFFKPLNGGPDQKGWPFGRSVYASEIYALLDRLPGVEYLTDVELVAVDSPDRKPRRVDKELDVIKLKPDELVEFKFDPTRIQIEDPTQKL
jgi:hypothetical protein